MARSLAGISSIVVMVALAYGPGVAQASDMPVLALVVKSPKPAYDWTVQSLEQALTPVGTWTARHNYEHAAKRLHLQNPMSPQAARRIGSDLGLTHVLFVVIRNTTSDGETKTFADIQLVDARTGTVLVKRSYFLPDHRMSAGTASYVADFLALRLNVHADDDAGSTTDDNVASGGRDENFGEMHGRDIDDVPQPVAPAAHPAHVRKKKSPVAFLNGLL